MSAFQMSANIQILFSEGERPFADRVRAAGAAGCGGIEFWRWRDKPLRQIADAAAETGLPILSMIVEPADKTTTWPFYRLVDPAGRDGFLAAVRESAEAAATIGCRGLVVVSGPERPGVPAAEQDQAIVDALRAAAPIVRAHGVGLLLEPLNTLIDHVGTYLSTTPLALDLLERTDRPEVALLYDVYHSVVMGERPAEVLAGRGDLVGHVQVADTDGRHEPGTGAIDWPRTLQELQTAGYQGYIGLEYFPTVESGASLRVLRDAIGAVPASA